VEKIDVPTRNDSSAGTKIDIPLRNDFFPPWKN